MKTRTIVIGPVRTFTKTLIDFKFYFLLFQFRHHLRIPLCLAIHQRLSEDNTICISDDDSTRQTNYHNLRIKANYTNALHWSTTNHFTTIPIRNSISWKDDGRAMRQCANAPNTSQKTIYKIRVSPFYTNRIPVHRHTKKYNYSIFRLF